MISFSIKELENFSGIKAHTIRTWEQRFSLLQPERSEGLRRMYRVEELKLVLDISFLNRNGLKISAIVKLDRNDLARKVSLFGSLHHTQHKAINELIICMAVMDPEGFEMVLKSCVLAWGIDDTIKEIILPFIQRSGMMQSGALKTNRLLIEQIIKQKLILGIERITASKNNQTMLFILSQKSAELQLLYLQYQMRMAGFFTLYISNEIQPASLLEMAAKMKPAYIISSGKKSHLQTESFLKTLKEKLPQTEVLNLADSVARFSQYISVPEFADIASL